MTIRLLALALVLAGGACGPSADESLALARSSLDAGDDDACQAAFRQALERHPDHLDLLLLACGFYLRPDAEDHYKPRLALHYASRARRADVEGRADVAAGMVRSLRAMGQDEDAETLLSEALVAHTDDEILLALSSGK